MKFMLHCAPAKVGVQEREALFSFGQTGERCCAASWAPAFAGERKGEAR